MAGLPGAGKDWWIARNRAELPVISLDRLRQEMGVKATDPQGAVIQAAYENARVHLRAGRDFVWNATNVTRQTRAKILGLLRDYKARSEMVYVETDPERLYVQNSNRVAQVPNAVIEHLVQKLEPPELWEVHALTCVV